MQVFVYLFFSAKASFRVFTILARSIFLRRCSSAWANILASSRPNGKSRQR